jgi:hypothetical protein
VTSPPDDQCLQRLNVPEGIQLLYLPQSTPDVFALIERGIVFLMAWWSGPARSAWSNLKEVLLKIDGARSLEIVVLDIDGMTGFENCLLGPIMAGVGESAWVRSGKPLTTNWVLWLGASEVAEANTELLIQMD